jgi:hypothetical protein
MDIQIGDFVTFKISLYVDEEDAVYRVLENDITLGEICNTLRGVPAPALWG